MCDKAPSKYVQQETNLNLKVGGPIKQPEHAIGVLIADRGSADDHTSEMSEDVRRRHWLQNQLRELKDNNQFSDGGIG